MRRFGDPVLLGSRWLCPALASQLRERIREAWLREPVQLNLKMSAVTVANQMAAASGRAGDMIRRAVRP